jgi:hypothetical protein
MGKTTFINSNGEKVKIKKKKVCSAHLGKEGRIFVGYYSGEWETHIAKDLWEAIHVVAKLNN